MLTDTHCHLSELDDIELKAQIDFAKENDVTTLIAIGAGYGIESNIKTLQIAKDHPHIYAALGIHPHDADKASKENLLTLKNLIAKNQKVKAIGETGLDYHYMHSSKEVQKKALVDFLGLARELSRPVIIHDRECGDDCLNILKNNNAKDFGGVVHCFSGSESLAFKYLDIGFYVSFSGIVTFKKSYELKEVVKKIPLDKILVETDSPFLTPVPYRGKKNQPAYVRFVAETVATLQEISYEELACQTTENARKLFLL